MMRFLRLPKWVGLTILTFLLGVGAQYLDAQPVPIPSRTSLPYLNLASYANIASGAGIRFGKDGSQIQIVHGMGSTASLAFIGPGGSLATAPTLSFGANALTLAGGQLLVSYGTQDAPSLAFTGSPLRGLYYATGGEIALVVDGSVIALNPQANDVLQFGIDAASPAAQTLKAADATGPGPTAGASLTLQGGTPAGAGAYGDLLAQTSGGNFHVGTSTTMGTGATKSLQVASLASVSYIQVASLAYANLGNGLAYTDAPVMIFCGNCLKQTPCAAGGTGAWARRVNTAWDCN